MYEGGVGTGSRGLFEALQGRGTGDRYVWITQSIFDMLPSEDTHDMWFQMQLAEHTAALGRHVSCRRFKRYHVTRYQA